MSWVKSGENLYTHDQAPFIIENLNGSWGIRDTRDKTSFIPFSDIFNNPVYPIDLSNADVIVKTLNAIGAITGDSLSIINASLSKHFRGEANNTPSTPAFSFQGDINSGFYRISEDRIGFSANGIRQGEFGVGYGGFTGNLIQLIFDTQNFQQSFTTTYSDVNKSSGVIWETAITPKLANSKIFILYSTSAIMSGTPAIMGIRIFSKIGSGSYNLIYRPQEEQNTGTIGPVEYGVDNQNLRSKIILPFYHNPTYTLGDTINYKIQIATNGGSSGMTLNVTRSTGNNGSSQCFLSEIAG